MAIKTLGSREVDQFLCEFHDIAPQHQTTYLGRVKHITRQGFPPGVGAGRGTPAQYDAGQFFQMLVVAELGEFYVPATHAIRFVSEAWPRLRETIRHVWSAVENGPKIAAEKIEPTFWRIPVEAQRHISRENRPYSPDSSYVLTVMTLEEVETAMREGGYNVRRHAFIAAHQVVRDALRQLGHKLGGDEALANFMEGLGTSADLVES